MYLFQTFKLGRHHFIQVILIFQEAKQLAVAGILAKIMEAAKLEMEEPLDHVSLIVLVDHAVAFLVDVEIATK